MKFVKRRIRNSVMLLIAVSVTYFALDVIELSLAIQQYYSGWIMALVALFLLMFYVRKKLSVVPFGNSSSWAQWHYYCGFFLLAVFLKHIEFSIPDGKVELTLSILLLVVSGVGIIGLIINRVFARRLAYLKEEIIFERISDIRKALQQRVEQRLLESIENSKSNTLADYYVTNLAHYFSGPRHTLAHLIGSNFAHMRIINQLQQQMRYLNEQESEFALELEKYIEQKNMLDTHFSLQRVLKYWGLLHSPISVVLAMMIILHIVLVYAFRGSA